ncbi:hypothetical protein HMI56_001315 [Coelomomyces lativittatus]|nr:hypothetical protein HMI56_001315 [Coelomomyces lativittatus]
MILFGSLRFACTTCVRGHRPTTCDHVDRSLIELRKKGRPSLSSPASSLPSSRPLGSLPSCGSCGPSCGCCGVERGRVLCSKLHGPPPPHHHLLPTSCPSTCLKTKTSSSVVVTSSSGGGSSTASASFMVIEPQRTLTFLSMTSLTLYQSLLEQGLRTWQTLLPRRLSSPPSPPMVVSSQPQPQPHPQVHPLPLPTPSLPFSFPVTPCQVETQGSSCDGTLSSSSFRTEPTEPPVSSLDPPTCCSSLTHDHPFPVHDEASPCSRSLPASGSRRSCCSASTTSSSITKTPTPPLSSMAMAIPLMLLPPSPRSMTHHPPMTQDPNNDLTDLKSRLLPCMSSSSSFSSPVLDNEPPCDCGCKKHQSYCQDCVEDFCEFYLVERGGGTTWGTA